MLDQLEPSIQEKEALHTCTDETNQEVHQLECVGLELVVLNQSMGFRIVSSQLSYFSH